MSENKADLSTLNRTLIIGGGYLGQRLAKDYVTKGPVDILTRSYEKKNEIENLGCGHFVADISNSTFRFSFKAYNRVILNASVTIDSRHKKAKDRLYIMGTKNVFHQMKKSKFKGKCIIIGSTAAIPDLSQIKPFKENGLTISEVDFMQRNWENILPSYQQYLLWQKEKSRNLFSILLIMSSGIYGPDRLPASRVRKGLRETDSHPKQLVNYIHVEDLKKAIVKLDAVVKESDLFFISDGAPVLRKDLYDSVSESFNMEKVIFNNFEVRNLEPVNGKRVSNEKLKNMGFVPEYTSVLNSLPVRDN